MWAIRRASICLKNRGFVSGTLPVCSAKSEISSCYVENCYAEIIGSQGKISVALVCSRRLRMESSSSKSYTKGHAFSSQAGAKSNGEQHSALEVAFSDPKSLNGAVQEASPGVEMDYGSIFDSELSEDENDVDGIENDVEKLDSETDVWKKKAFKNRGPPPMTKGILADPALHVSNFLDKWGQAGNEVTQKDISTAIFYLRKQKMFIKALQLCEWSESLKDFEFTERKYASHLDLIAKVRGIFEAEEYLHQIPESFRGESVYGSLLANYVLRRNTEKSVEVFDKMRNLFPLGLFSCEQLLLLYKKTNRKKISDVLSLMEKNNIKLSSRAYRILIDVKGQSNDISGMEQVLEKMKSDGVGLDTLTKATVARYYAANGRKDEAKALLKKIGVNLMGSRWLCRYLLPIYAFLRREDEVKRIWEVCESNPWPTECMAAIEAWVQLKRIKDAEAAFDKMLGTMKTPSPKHYALLLNMYTSRKMFAKGKTLVARMANYGITRSPVVWDALVGHYVRTAEVEEAESVLSKALEWRTPRPIVVSYVKILDEYAKKGDVCNAEKIFLKMRELGYPVRIRSYRSLLQAYINAKTPAFGFVERMAGDKIVPDKELADLLDQANTSGYSTAAQMQK